MAGPNMFRKDSQWAKQAFMVTAEQLDKVDFQNRTFTSAALKFTDTTPGGNFSINPPPQFTRFCDIRAEGRFSRNRTGKHTSGMGRYYSEAIDDNQQIIHMRMGVPQFNSLSTFFTGFYNGEAGQLARTGRAQGMFYTLGRAAGFVVSVMSWQLLAVHLIGVGLRFALEKPSSKFYYLKPTMPLYWNAVNTMVNHIAVNRGIVPRVMGADTQKINPGYEFSEQALADLHKILPDIFKEKGGIDVYALANRAQRLAHKHQKRMQQVVGNGGEQSLEQMSKTLQEIYRQDIKDDGASYERYLKTWLDSAASKPDQAAGVTSEQMPDTPEKKQTFWAKLGEFFEAELDDGSAFASFRVNSTGPVNESFSNSATESEIANKINSLSSQSRSSSFNFANGNIVGGAVGEAVGAVTGAMKNFLGGMADQLQISGLAALGGAAFVDIPKHWQSSQAQLPRASYTIDLVSPYGNPISQLLNIYIPLSMLLAAALPLSTGKQSYTAPFLVELYDKGRCQTRLGMIDSMSITRGTGNLGFNNEGHAMAVQVTFSVLDMSSVMHMPIAEGISLSSAANTAVAAAAGTIAGGAIGGAAGAVFAQGVFDDDTVFSDYMAVLSGMDLADQIYPMRKLKLNLTRRMVAWDSFFSVGRFAQWAGDTMPARLLSVIYKGTDR